MFDNGWIYLFYNGSDQIASDNRKNEQKVSQEYNDKIINNRYSVTCVVNTSYPLVGGDCVKKYI